MALNSLDVAKKAAKAADEKSAEDILVLGMDGISILADYFVICSGTSTTQVNAIVNSIEGELEEKIELIRKEGTDGARWAVLDYGDVIIHVFHDEQREYYQLEKLWGDAERIDWSK
ncbi:ribosome silencing factor [Halanaerobacter jeridensis]|uniref:Ribosomal silencing factor RsfS n=1 Tax=Halanaerobacter jeridensis TaxID=706427 RepID=A0A938XR71_9FIRM|nr:ribosome silencing factor [Halanaerobacter jeridensis]MBM7556214.1 ribosome-associated protein [Halanaerobacter jeridensis]